MMIKWKMRHTLLTGTLIIAFAVLPGLATAMNFQMGKDTSIDCDVTVTYGAGWRVSDRDDDKRFPNIDVNLDDANENFDQWSMINNKLTLFADIDIQHKNMGIFVRPKAFYDHVYMSDNDNQSPATNNALAGGLIDDADEWADDVEDIHGRDAEILDLFAYAGFQLGGRNINLRAGRQVVAWGESLYVSGGVSSAQSPVDYSAAVAVGTEVKEIYLPTGAVSLQAELTPELALMGYYQWEWEKTRLMEGGTFFAQADFFDEIKAPQMLGPSGLGLPTIGRASDEDASDSGQFGIGLTWVTPWVNDTEIGLYYINYHDKTPTLNMDLGFLAGGVNPPTYWLSYTEDIKLYGASFSSLIGEVNVSGEFSYRDIGAMGNYWQAQASWLYSTNFPFCDSLGFNGEVACGREIGTADDTFAWKYVLNPTFKWNQVFKNTDLELPLAFSDQPSGTNALGDEGSASGSIGVNVIYKYRLKGSLTYENRFNSVRNYASDRDTLALKLSYTF